MIHYHGTPMTPVADMIRAFRGRHAIVSYEHPQQIDVAAEICQSVVLDNGAFSAWRQKKNYDFKGYYEWARKWLRHPAVEWCVIPDKIDGTEDENDELLIAWHLPTSVSVPVYHFHESLHRLHRLTHQYPRVAIGSSGQFATPGAEDWWKRVAEIMDVACDNEGIPYAKLHGLRMLDPVIFSHLPLASADSCNVARNVGIDMAWNGPYAPRSRAMRGLIMMDRIESHASASRWSRDTKGVQHNLELVG